MKTLEGMIIPSKDPVGVRLLRLMGWREGQGIGPRKEKLPSKSKDKPKGNDDTDIYINRTLPSKYLI